MCVEAQHDMVTIRTLIKPRSHRNQALVELMGNEVAAGGDGGGGGVKDPTGGGDPKLSIEVLLEQQFGFVRDLNQALALHDAKTDLEFAQKYGVAFEPRDIGIAQLFALDDERLRSGFDVAAKTFVENRDRFGLFGDKSGFLDSGGTLDQLLATVIPEYKVEQGGVNAYREGSDFNVVAHALIDFDRAMMMTVIDQLNGKESVGGDDRSLFIAETTHQMGHALMAGDVPANDVGAQALSELGNGFDHGAHSMIGKGDNSEIGFMSDNAMNLEELVVDGAERNGVDVGAEREELARQRQDLLSGLK